MIKSHTKIFANFFASSSNILFTFLHMLGPRSGSLTHFMFLKRYVITSTIFFTYSRLYYTID